MIDERFEGEIEEQGALRDDRRDYWKTRSTSSNSSWRMNVKRDRKLDELLGLTDHIAKESGRGDQEKVLIFTEYRRDAALPRRANWKRSTAKARSS